MIKLVVSGCCGKMGRRIISLCLGDSKFELAGAIEAKSHPAIGKKLSEILMNPALDIEVKDDPQLIKEADVLIEFTNPSTTASHLALAVKYKKAVVIGTTGLESEQLRKVKEASGDIPIVFSPNMSIGVNLVFKLVKEAAQKLGKDYKADIVEAHHIHKKDAPSGTAKRLAQLIGQARPVPNCKLSQQRIWNGARLSSDKQGGQAAGCQSKHIKIKSIREGEIVGEHQVRLSSPEDVIIIKHSAKTRDIFARGALEAAKFVAKQAPGLYDMQDVIDNR